MNRASLLAIVIACLAALTQPAPVDAADGGCAPQAPCYSAGGITNSASGEVGRLAPYTFVTIYGTNLSYATRERRVGDGRPELAGVRVHVQDIPALVTYVSPTQVNALIPYSLKANREVLIQVFRDGDMGPRVPVWLSEFAPAFFQDGPENVVAQREDYTLIRPDTPGRPGGYAILYLTGLGSTVFVQDDLEPTWGPVRIRARADLQLLLDGEPVEDHLIEYAGLTPTIPGLYQINLKLPETASPNPEIRVMIRGELSRPGLFLPLAPVQE